MTALAEGQASSCTLPVLQLFAVDPDNDGFISDIDSGTYRILDADGTEIVGATAFDTDDCPSGDRLGVGRYVIPLTVPATPKLGTWTVELAYKHTAAGTDRTQTLTFEVLGSVADPMARTYTTVSAMRDAGVSAASIKAGPLRDLIVLASAYVEHYTGRFFVPVPKTILADGNGARGIQLNEAIVAMGQVRILLSSITPSDSAIDPASIRVYNRHLLQGLTDPDDRDNPRVEFFFHENSATALVSASTPLHSFHWMRGRQNISFEGVFGYTDPDGTPLGKTPTLIEHATKLLVMRNAPGLTDADARQDAQNAWRLTELRTRDQTVKYGFDANSPRIVGSLTGDPEIDSILARYARPIQIGSA